MFATHLKTIQNACKVLESDPVTEGTLGRLVREGLQDLAEHHVEFDAVVEKDFAFKKHFFDLLASLPDHDDGAVFALFEDLALFARARAMFNGMDCLSPCQCAILHHFETSGHWLPNDMGNAVCRFFWYDLPQQARS